MRILLWHGYLLGGTGSNVYTRQLAREWSAAGHEVVVVCQERHPELYDLGGAQVVRPDPGPVLPVFVLDRYEGIEARLLQETTEAERARFVDANAAALRDLGPADCVFANHVLLGGPVGAASGLPFAVKAHGSELEYSMRGRPELCDWARDSLAGARAVFVGSAHIRSVLEEVVGGVERVVEVPPGVDVDEWRPRPRDEALAALLDEARADPPNPGSANERLPDAGNADRLAAFLAGDRPTVVYFGKLIRNKGVHLLLDALRGLGARAVVVGFGDYRAELEARAAGLDVLFTGPLEHRHLVQLLPLADACVVPSIFPEAFGMVAAEAAATGCLPLVARHSGLAEIADGLEQEYPERFRSLTSFETGDAADLRAKLEAILSLGPADRAVAGEAARRAVVERWSWAGVARRLLEPFRAGGAGHPSPEWAGGERRKGATMATRSRKGTRQPIAPNAAPVAHLTPAERVARGRAARNEVPRSSHGNWEPSSARPDPVALLESQAVTRVPELVPIRYGRMLVSPFTFFRGAALIMAADLAATPRTGLNTQLCGDAHLSNFGIFGTPERRLVFDINDFDETLPGPWEWDVKRLAASFAVAGRDRGFTAKQRAAAVRAVAEHYRTAMRDFAAMSNLDVWYASLDVEKTIESFRGQFDAKQVARTEATVAKARTKDSLRAFDKLTHLVDGERRIISDPPLIVPVEELVDGISREQLLDWIRTMFREYRRTLTTDRRRLLEQYNFVHFARKVVGVGSVGTRAWIALFLGRDDGDPLFLQAKEAQPSVLEPFLGRSEYDNCGHRVVAGQRLMQAASDTFLGYRRVEAGLDGLQRDFYVRQLHDWKGSADLESITPVALPVYGRLCGWTLARAHARSGDRIAIAAYLGNGTAFDEAMVSFAEAYADQNERDYALLRAAADEGRIEVVSGL